MSEAVSRRVGDFRVDIDENKDIYRTWLAWLSLTGKQMSQDNRFYLFLKGVV